MTATATEITNQETSNTPNTRDENARYSEHSQGEKNQQETSFYLESSNDVSDSTCRGFL